MTPNANASGQSTLTDRTITRLGFEVMRLTGEGVWGQSKDREEALRVLQRLPELGVNFIDAADSYGHFVAEYLIAEALHPYDNMFVATKGERTRTGPSVWPTVGYPEYLWQSKVWHLEENVAAAQVELSDEQFQQLDEAGQEASAA